MNDKLKFSDQGGGEERSPLEEEVGLGGMH
jgi:hypothetical protein